MASQMTMVFLLSERTTVERSEARTGFSFALSVYQPERQSGKGRERVKDWTLTLIDGPALWTDVVLEHDDRQVGGSLDDPALPVGLEGGCEPGLSRRREARDGHEGHIDEAQ